MQYVGENFAPGIVQLRQPSEDQVAVCADLAGAMVIERTRGKSHELRPCFVIDAIRLAHRHGHPWLVALDPDGHCIGVLVCEPSETQGLKIVVVATLHTSTVSVRGSDLLDLASAQARVEQRSHVSAAPLNGWDNPDLVGYYAHQGFMWGNKKDMVRPVGGIFCFPPEHYLDRGGDIDERLEAGGGDGTRCTPI
jgi:hypothetical protein